MSGSHDYEGAFDLVTQLAMMEARHSRRYDRPVKQNYRDEDALSLSRARDFADYRRAQAAQKTSPRPHWRNQMIGHKSHKGKQAKAVSLGSIEKPKSAE
jgi:hypothetical protein